MSSGHPGSTQTRQAPALPAQTRACVFDTETTGLDADAGDRIIQIAAAEIIDLRPTGRRFAAYVNPDGRPVQWASYIVHGIDPKMLVDAPGFGAVWTDFLAFVGESRLIAHNAPFDVRFLSAECRRAGLADFTLTADIEDSINLARRLWPGAPVSLDAIAKRLGVDLSRRKERHQADIDCDILADVYCRMRRLSATPRVQADLFAAPAQAAAADVGDTPIVSPILRMDIPA